MSESTTDRIEKRIVLRAPRARVWRALADAEEFGTWFEVDLAGQAFVPGKWARGRVTHPGYEHLMMDILVERVEPERLIAWRWCPYPLEPGEDPARAPMTLVTFELADAPEGTLLTVVESGFDQVPLERRAAAFRENEKGWTEQMANIERHVSRAA